MRPEKIDQLSDTSHESRVVIKKRAETLLHRDVSTAGTTIHPGRPPSITSTLTALSLVGRAKTERYRRVLGMLGLRLGESVRIPNR